MIICCIGDSLTEGDYGIPGVKGVANVQEKGYPWFLQQLSGAEVRNFGRCGCRSSHQWQWYQEGLWNLDGADIILMMLGTNGGQSADGDSEDNRAYCSLLAALHMAHPAARLVCITPPHVTENPAYSNCGYAEQVREAVGFVRRMAPAMGVELLDMAANPRFCAETEATYQANDGLHFVEAGYQALAEEIWQALQAKPQKPSGQDCVKTLSMPLPEDILKQKWAGDLEGAERAIEARLRMELPEMLRRRLLAERELLHRLATQYKLDEKAALEQMRKIIPGLTEDQFRMLEENGWVDYLYIQGEKRYFIRAVRSLAQNQMVKRMAGIPINSKKDYLDAMIRQIKEQGSLRKTITIRHSLCLEQDAFVPGTYRAWLPYPAPTAQQSDIALLDGTPTSIAPEDAHARTAYWEGAWAKAPEYAVTYRYTSTIRYADPLHAPAPAAPLYLAARPVCEEDLAEDDTHIRFTPYLRSLAADITAGAATEAEKAWRCYEFVTTKVGYSFMREYYQIDNLGEYCAINLKGDCGLQALLFIILCRINGIPARWQSGRSIDEDSCGYHDWAQFYLPGWGWLFADPSYGGSAYRNGNAERHQFYFGNIDPMRMAANRTFMPELTPAMQAFRVDPYDSQGGEIELVGADLGFTGRNLDDTAEVLSVE